MIVLQRKPVEVPAWNLINQSQMLDALSHLTAQGWRGAVTYNPASGSWRLELNADDPTRQVIAETGQWLVLDMGLRTMPADEVEANYQELGS